MMRRNAIKRIDNGAQIGIIWVSIQYEQGAVLR